MILNWLDSDPSNGLAEWRETLRELATAREPA